MRNKKLKVVWICHFSDSKVRAHISFSRFYYKYLKDKTIINRDKAVWISNAINEFEKYDDIDLTIIFPHPAIKGHLQEFSINGINYKCYRSEDDNVLSNIFNKLFKLDNKRLYFINRALIKQLVNQISPDIVHVIGAENPYYSLSALDVPHTIPLIVSLQTLMSEPTFRKKYPIDNEHYIYRSKLETNVIKRSDYLASRIKTLKEEIRNNIKPDAVFLHLSLAVGQELDFTPINKEFDFVYFAADISKAADYAIEAFAIVASKRGDITLNISGSYSSEIRTKLDERINDLGLSNQIFFTGPQPTHQDVLKQIKKSKYALLPLKVDLISSTIREAMACGLPVITTRTAATPDLNINRQSVLLSDEGDYYSMSENMERVLDDEEFAFHLRDNAFLTITEQYSNDAFMRKWRKAYYQVIENFKLGTPFTTDIVINE